MSTPCLLMSLPLAALVAGCSYFDIPPSTCPAGVGLRAAPYVGDQLPDKAVALSFDGGPGEVMSKIGDYLYANEVRAAFFVRGDGVFGNEDKLARLKRQGHLVGSRGFDGKALDGAADPITAMRRTDALITPYVTGDMYLLRAGSASQGAMPAGLAERLNGAGLTRYVGPIGWDVGDQSLGFEPDDACWARGRTADTCAQNYLTALRQLQRGIVLMHAERLETVGMLTTVVAKLKEEGFNFTRLDEAPELRSALLRSGGAPGKVGGDGGCREY